MLYRIAAAKLVVPNPEGQCGAVQRPPVLREETYLAQYLRLTRRRCTVHGELIRHAEVETKIQIGVVGLRRTAGIGPRIAEPRFERVGAGHVGNRCHGGVDVLRAVPEQSADAAVTSPTAILKKGRLLLHRDERTPWTAQVGEIAKRLAAVRIPGLQQ